MRVAPARGSLVLSCRNLSSLRLAGGGAAFRRVDRTVCGTSPKTVFGPSLKIPQARCPSAKDLRCGDAADFFMPAASAGEAENADACAAARKPAGGVRFTRKAESKSDSPARYKASQKEGSSWHW